MSTSDNTTIPLKRCTKCGRIFPLNHLFFSTKSCNKDGFTHYCRGCRSSWDDDKFQLTILVEVLQQKGYRVCTICYKVFPATTEYFAKQNSQKCGLLPHCKSCTRNQRQIDNDKIIERRRIYRQLKGDWLKAQSREHYQLNRQRHNQRCRDYREKNKEQLRLYRQAKPDIAKTVYQRRRARKRSLPDTWTVQDWQHALDYFNGCCAICGRQLKDLFQTHTAAADHWIALNHPDCPGTVPTNMVPLCHGTDGCNNSKQDKLPADWLTERFGKQKASAILKRIQDYFDSL